jgi:Mg-chelatase subunit ChlD
VTQRLTYVAIGVIFAAGVAYNVWTWRTPSASSSNTSAPAATAAAPPAAPNPEAALAPLVPAPPPLTATSLNLPVESGSLDIELAAKVNEQHEPQPAAVEFDESVPDIFVAIKSNLPEGVTVGVTFRRLPNESVPARDLETTTVRVPAGQRGSGKVHAPREGFLPGNYELVASINNINPQTLAFRITSRYADARKVVAAEGIPALNVAVAALGGKIASSNAGLKSPAWAVTNLIDGFAFQIGGAGCSVCGWTSGNDDAPFDIVFELAGGRPITIDSVLIDPSTEETTSGGEWNLIPRNVEVSASTTSATDGFQQIGAARIMPRAVEQLIRFQPTPARFVKLHILNNWGGNTTHLSEVKVFEASGPSALEGWPRNLALPALGGVVARFTSQNAVSTGVQQLIDNELSEPWTSADHYLPQDFVFAFKDDQVAKIDKIVLRPQGGAPDTWPRKILVSVSQDSLFQFDDVATFELPKDSRDHEFSIKRDARFLRVRILENYGGRETTLNEVRIFEASAPGYTTVLARTAPLASPSIAAAEAAVKADLEEQEQNDDRSTANRIDAPKTVGGKVEPLGEIDTFAIDIPSDAAPGKPGGRRVLSLGIAGSPYIKTSVSLLDAGGKELKRFDPAQAAGPKATVSWLVEPGKQFLQVSEPPASIVLIWDTSGSMNGMTDALREAVLTYLSQVRPTEKLNLIRFSDDVEVLLPEFSSDPNVLRNAAISDKFYPDGGTRFYDAVEKAVALLAPMSGNRAIIVLSDGEDSLSKMEAPRFWSLLQQEQVRLYTIGLGVALKGFATRIGSTGQRFMAHSSYVTNGRSFFARDTSELKALYERIAAELRAVSRYTLSPTVSQALGRVSIAATGERIASVSAPARVQLVLDASGSMNRRIGTKPMIDSAKDVLAAVIKAMPDDVQVGLRVYGHRIREGQRGACEDSQQVQPIAKLDRARLLSKVRAISALGTTPIAYSLEQVATDLGKTEGQQMVVLVTDGREECGGDPKAAVAALKAQGLKVRVNVVGFALTDKLAQQQLAEAAALTGGNYVNAKDDAALKDAIDAAMRVPFEIRDSSGAVVASGQVGQDALQVPEGQYTVVVQAAPLLTIPNVRVIADRESKVELKKEGREIGVKVNQP